MKEKKEITAYSVGVGLLMTVIFSAAAAYLGLKVGQVFEAAIPISIIAVGLTGALNKKNGLAQNVIIQSIGSCSGVIVAGAIFTLPAIYILGLDVNFTQMFLSSLLGGFLGILFLIPFRKYFVKEMDGQYPFPEATATTQVLMSGEEGGNSTKTLITAGLIGGLYGIHRGLEIRIHHLLRLVSGLARNHPGNEPALRKPGHRPDGYGHRADRRRDVAGYDF